MNRRRLYTLYALAASPARPHPRYRPRGVRNPLNVICVTSPPAETRGGFFFLLHFSIAFPSAGRRTLKPISSYPFDLMAHTACSIQIGVSEKTNLR